MCFLRGCYFWCCCCGLPPGDSLSASSSNSVTLKFLLLVLVSVVRKRPKEAGMMFHPILMNPLTKKLGSGPFISALSIIWTAR
jgi:hypothetical protein